MANWNLIHYSFYNCEKSNSRLVGFELFVSKHNNHLGVIVAEKVRQLLGIRKKTGTETGMETGTEKKSNAISGVIDSLYCLGPLFSERH